MPFFMSGFATTHRPESVSGLVVLGDWSVNGCCSM
jgi:hypothetical protein